VNFLIRDVRVRKLLGDDREPLIPLTDRIKELAAAGFSFILVAGACGDYLDLADNIIVMANYKAECAKLTPAPSTSSWRGEAPTGSTEPAEVTKPRAFATYMQPLQKSVRPTSAVERQVKVKLAGDTLLQIGFLVSDTSRLNTLVDKQQRFGAGFLLLNLLQNAASNTDADSSGNTAAKSVAGVAQKLCENIKNVGFRNLPQGMSREMSLPRPVDIACVAFRLREGK
jgi:hypothetical protein